MKKNLSEVYNPKKFKEIAHELVDLLGEHLEESHDKNNLVQNWKVPAEQLSFWQKYEYDQQMPNDFFKDILQNYRVKER